jgi:hypothetical protein
MSREDYERGYNTGYVAAKRGQSRAPNYSPKKEKAPVIGYGLTAGAMAVIKMEVKKFNHSYKDLAKHYGVTENAIRQIIESKQFADIKPRGES